MAFNASARAADGLARICRACTNARRRQRERSSIERSQSIGEAAKQAAALRQGDIKAVQKLVRYGTKPHWSWVCEAMREGHLALARELLGLGVDPNAFTMAAMADVAGLTHGLHRMPTDACLAANMQPASHRLTPLHVACASDWTSQRQSCMTTQVRVAEILKDHGADLNAVARYRGINDVTPLFCACWSSRNLALVRWLLDQGAPVTGGELLAALGHFQRHGRETYDFAEALVAWGVPVNGEDRPLLQAFAHQGVSRTVSWLIARGADVHARGPGGRTAAHFAAERNTGPKALGLLVEGGANLLAKDEDGLTPMEIAKLNGKKRLAEWIAKQLRRKSR